MILEPGIYTNLSSEDYHADRESISRSALMDFKRSSFYYWSKHLNPDRPAIEQKPSWIFGSAFHTLILEPSKFLRIFSVKPESQRLKDVGPDLYYSIQSIIKKVEESGLIVLTTPDHYKLLEMSESLLSNNHAKDLLENSIIESSYVWKDEASGLIVKSRPDILHPNMYVDLKTIDDASPHSFQKSMAAYGYHIQAAMVCDGVEALTGRKLSACINICVEKTYPYSVGIYIIDEAAIDHGRNEYQSLLLNLKACIMSGEWPDYQPETVGLPRWYL